MERLIYHILDIFFIVFHSSVIIFNLSAWIFRKTRQLNLIILLLTGGSWLILGLFVGTIGYCPLTDWHFHVLEKLGHTDLPYSYVKYLTERVTGLSISSSLVDRITLYSYLAALTISFILNIRDSRAGRKK